MSHASNHEIENIESVSRVNPVKTQEVTSSGPLEVPFHGGNGTVVIHLSVGGKIELYYSPLGIITLAQTNKENQLHCDFGPAVTAFHQVASDMLSQYYWLNGKQLSLEDWLKKTGNKLDVNNQIYDDELLSRPRRKLDRSGGLEEIKPHQHLEVHANHKGGGTVIVHLWQGHRLELCYSDVGIHTIRQTNEKNQLHCDFGPAVTAFDQPRSSMLSQYYWLDGVNMSLDNWLIRTGNKIDVNNPIKDESLLRKPPRFSR